ncbi:MAG: hypothetical protein RBS88_03690 [Spongiibacteraceae bacterium]|nr:hypothetical protein [Spongiibacteraceae bacterium]
MAPVRDDAAASEAENTVPTATEQAAQAAPVAPARPEQETTPADNASSTPVPEAQPETTRVMGVDVDLTEQSAFNLEVPEAEPAADSASREDSEPDTSDSQVEPAARRDDGQADQKPMRSLFDPLED